MTNEECSEDVRRRLAGCGMDAMDLRTLLSLSGVQEAWVDEMLLTHTRGIRQQRTIATCGDNAAGLVTLGFILAVLAFVPGASNAKGAIQ